MTVIVVDGPGGQRAIQTDDQDLVASLKAQDERGAIRIVSVSDAAPVDDGFDHRTVKELRAMLDEAGIGAPPGAKKADLVAALEADPED